MAEPIDLRRDPRWQAGRRITRAIEQRYGSEWSPWHQRLAERLLAACDDGVLHECNVPHVLSGRMRLPR